MIWNTVSTGSYEAVRGNCMAEGLEGSAKVRHGGNLLDVPMNERARVRSTKDARAQARARRGARVVPGERRTDE